MSEGFWMTVSVTLFGIFGTVIAAIVKMPRKERTRAEDMCSAHSGIVSDISGLRDGQHEIQEALKDIRHDVKTLVQRR